MSKNKDELNALKKEVENVNEKLHELTPEELEQVTGGAGNPFADVLPGTGDEEYRTRRN